MASFVNPPSLYTGGNAKFDSTPSVNVYAKLLAQRQAKEDAMGEYVRNLNTKITPSGMRVQDIPAFSDMKDKWQRFGIANQRRMANDPRLRASFDAMGQQLINFANESKAEEEAKKPLVGILTDPKKRMELSDEVFPMIAEHDKPLYQQDANGNFVRDYNRKRLDYTHELFNPPDFDFNKNFEGWAKGMSMGKQYEQDATKYRKEPTTGSVFIPFQETYSPEQVKQIGANAENFVKGNKGADRYFSNKLGHISEDDYNKYNKIYQDAFGSKTVAGIPTNNITEPEQLAAAQAIEKATGTVGKRGEELKSDYEKRKNDALAKMEYSSRLIEGRDRKRAEQSAKNTSGNAFDEVPNVSLKSGGKIENGSVYDKDGNLYNGEIALKGEHLPASVITVLGKGGISIPPGKNVTIRVLNGQIQSIKPEGKNEINRQFMQNEQLKYNTEPQKGQQMKFGATDEKQQSKKTYTYNGKSYTEDQVKKAASNLKMTFDEYIKKYNLK